MLLGMPNNANKYFNSIKSARDTIQAKIGNKYSVIVCGDLDSASIVVMVYPCLCCVSSPIMISKWTWIDWYSTRIEDIAATVADELKKETTVVKEYMDRYEEKKDDN